MMNLHPDAVLWLVGWSFIGSSLGFFTIRDKPQWTKSERFKEYLVSVSVGIFFAFPVYTILCEKEIFSCTIDIMIAGSTAFATTDCIINFWPKFIEGVNIAIPRILNRFIRKI